MSRCRIGSRSTNFAFTRLSTCRLHKSNHAQCLFGRNPAKFALLVIDDHDSPLRSGENWEQAYGVAVSRTVGKYPSRAIGIPVRSLPLLREERPPWPSRHSQKLLQYGTTRRPGWNAPPALRRLSHRTRAHARASSGLPRECHCAPTELD